MTVAQAVAALVCLITAAGSASLNGKSYSGVTVQLPADIAEENQNNILQGIRGLLTETSGALLKASGLRFDTVIIQVPLSWKVPLNIEKCTIGTKWKSTTDVVVTSGEPSVFGRLPHAVQYGGCGTQGLHVNVPVKFLVEDNPIQTISKGKLMAREWIKYRYGVYDENGFANDPRFPLYSKIHGAEDIRVTSCSNTPIAYTQRDKTEKDCTLSVDESNNFPTAASECTPRADFESNENVTSSLMNLQPLRNVNYLCGDDGHPHQQDLPNKQNALCKGKSIWSVLREHPDFKGQRIDLRETIVPDPVFCSVRETANRVVVAIDAYKGLDSYQTLIRNAVVNLIYSLPEHSEFGTTVSNEAKLVVLPPRDDSDYSNLNNFIKKILIFAFQQPQACPACAVESAVQMLSSGGQKGGTVLLISGEDPRNMGSGVLDQIKAASLCLVAVHLTNDPSKVFNIVPNSDLCGAFYSIPASLSTAAMGQLYEAVECTIEPKTYTEEIKVKAAEMNENTQMTFSTDRTVSSFKVWLSGTSPEFALNVYEKDVECTPLTGSPPQVQQIMVERLFVLQFQNVPSSTWTCRLKTGLSVFMKVTSTLKPGDRFTIDSWTRDTTEPDASQQMPVIIYAKVFYAVHPVIGAKVQAEIKTPDGLTETLSLFDNGLGDPDITKNDGIYSRYFTKFTRMGNYEVLVSVTNINGETKIGKPSSEAPVSCCGSVTNVGKTDDIQDLSRTIKVLFMARSGPAKVEYAPTTIMDLQLVRDASYQFKLAFTAPGSDKDSGKASKYILKQSREYQDLNKNDKQAYDLSLSEDTSKPKSYGEKEELQLLVTNKPQVTTTYFLAITAISAKEIESDLSNVVQLVLSENTPTPSPDPESQTFKPQSLDNSTIAYISGAVVIIFVLVVYLLFCIWNRRRRKVTESAATKTEETGSANSAENLNNNDDGSVTASNEWSMDRDPISPINSMPASVLIYHHEQVKEAKRRRKKPPLFKLEDMQNSNLHSVSDIFNAISTSADQNGSYYTEETDLGQSPDLSMDSEPTERRIPTRRVTKV